jgi:hypothetical protein
MPDPQKLRNNKYLLLFEVSSFWGYIYEPIDNYITIFTFSKTSTYMSIYKNEFYCDINIYIAVCCVKNVF